MRVYTANELKKKFPEGLENAHNDFIKRLERNPEIPWQSEIMDSLKAIIKQCNFTLRDWSIGAYCYSSVRIEFCDTYEMMEDEDGEEYEERFDVGEFEKIQATNYIFEELEISKAEKVFYEHEGKKYHRWDVTKKNGEPWSCELTGVCFDDDYLKYILDELESGRESIKDIFNGLVDVASKLMENEWESQQTLDYFLEEARCNDWEFTKDGKRI